MAGEALESLDLLAVFLEVAVVAVCVAALVVVQSYVPRITFRFHRRALRSFMLAGAFFAASELFAVWKELFGLSAFTEIGEDLSELLAVLSGFAGAYFMHGAERKEVSFLERSANVDDLTGLSNRGFFRRAAARRIEFSRANGVPLHCAVVDVDDFKPYNDRFGHEAGDRALRCVARVLCECVRADDIVARYGGEEFVLLIGGERGEAVWVAERIREEVERSCSPERNPSLKRAITVSLGVAPLAEEALTPELLVAAADERMYRAKRAGKNRVSFTN